MAILRDNPKCGWCGEIIAKGIYLDQSDIPRQLRIIGDTFQRWEYFDHKCKGSESMKKEIEISMDEQDTFFKPNTD